MTWQGLLYMAIVSALIISAFHIRSLSHENRMLVEQIQTLSYENEAMKKAIINADPMNRRFHYNSHADSISGSPLQL